MQKWNADRKKPQFNALRKRKQIRVGFSTERSKFELARNCELRLQLKSVSGPNATSNSISSLIRAILRRKSRQELRLRRAQKRNKQTKRESRKQTQQKQRQNKNNNKSEKSFNSSKTFCNKKRNKRKSELLLAARI